MIDITMNIEKEMKVYKNKEEKKPVFSHKQSNHVFETKATLDMHTGTHIDFPLHMIPDGKTSNDYTIEHFSGTCYVKDATYLNQRILKRDLQAIHIETYDFILFKTKNSFSDDFNPEYIYLSEEAAAYLAEFDLKGVGIDALGIERAQEGHPTHQLLLSKDILIYEGLNLKDVEEGVYEFIGLPIKTESTEAAPVRAMLR